MAFKVKPILSPRQLRRVKFTTAMAASILLGLGVMSNFINAEEDEEITWNNEKWASMDVHEYPRGRIVYFSKNTEVCASPLLIPGVATLSRTVLAFAYGFCLCYLFMGIAIVAEIFMEAIEKITSKVEFVTIKEADGRGR